MALPSDAVLIVIGGSTGPGGEIARAAANRGCAVVVVYLEDQIAAEAVVDAIIGSNGTAVAVRADVSDDMDVQRLFDEAVALFGGVDVLVHTDSRDSSVIDQRAAGQLRRGGSIARVADSTELAAVLDRWEAGQRTPGI